jgi:hypothetical protein
VLKRKYMIIALTIASVLLGSLFYNNITQAQSSVKVTANIMIIIEMTSYHTILTFNGLSIKDVYAFTVTDGSPALTYPYVMLNAIILAKEPVDASYFRMEMPLKVFASNETVSILLYHLPPPTGVETYVTVKIYDNGENLIGSFTIVGTEYGAETFYIQADEFRPSK